VGAGHTQQIAQCRALLLTIRETPPSSLEYERLQGVMDEVPCSACRSNLTDKKHVCLTDNPAVKVVTLISIGCMNKSLKTLLLDVQGEMG